VTESKYARIADELRSELRSYTEGQRFLSENQVAIRFGVARPTAARALSELCLDGLIERRVGSGTFVCESAGRTAAGGRTIGILLSGLGATEAWDPLATWLTRVCSSRGISIRMGSEVAPQDDAVSAVIQAKDLISQRVEGVLFSPLEAVPDRQKENETIVSMFADACIPVVLLDRDVLDFPARSALDLVGVDNVYAAAEIGYHIAESGHTRPRFFSRPNFPSTTDLRVAGCAIALARAGIDLPHDWHVTGDPADPVCVERLLHEQQPDSIIASNDQTAALLIRTLTQLGYRVPEDVAVVGFDDVIYSTVLTVPLTTVHQPFDTIAQTAIQVLLDRIERPDAPTVTVQLPGTLIVRGSSAAQ